MDQDENINAMETKMILLRDENGPFLTEFLAETSCDGEACNIDRIFDGRVASIMWKGRRLNLQRFRTMSNFKELRSRFLNLVLAELMKYFPDGSYKDYSIFQPNKLPTEKGIF